MLEYYKFKTVFDLFMKGLEQEARAQLMELQRRYVAICDENTTLKMQLQEYEDILYLERNLFYDGTFYWLVTGSIKQGPFCAHCYNTEGALMRLSGEWHERYCPSCRTSFATQAATAVEAGFTHGAMQEVACLPDPHRERAKVIPFVKG